MYGINRFHLLGKVLNDPVECRMGSAPVLGYQVDGSRDSMMTPGATRGVKMWCFSIGMEVGIVRDYHLRAGDYVVMYGVVFMPPKFLLEAVGVRHWSVSLSGRPLAVLDKPSFRNKNGMQKTAEGVLTGRVLEPGPRQYIAKTSGKPYLQFCLQNEVDFWVGNRWQHFESKINACYNVWDGTKDDINTGAVLMCRGGLLNWGEKERVWMWCSQIESLGVVTREIMEREHERCGAG